MRRAGLIATGRATGPTVGAGLTLQLAVLVSGVVAARILGVEDRGYLALLALFPAIMAQFGALGVPLAVTYFVSKAPGEARLVVRTAARIAVGQAAVLLVMHVLLLWIVLADHATHVRTAALFTLASVPAALAQHYGLAVLQGQGRLRVFNVLRLLAPAAYSVTIVALLLVGAGSLPRVTLAWVAANAAVAAAILATAARGLPAAGRGRTDARPLIRFGSRSLLGYASPIDSFRVDQAVVGLLLSPAALGVYVVALAFTNLPRFVAQSIGLVAYPAVARERPGQRENAVWRFVLLTALVAAAIVGALELLAGRLVPLFFGADFDGAITVARILLIGAFFLSVRRVLTDAARGAGRTAAGSAAEVVSWLGLAPALLLFAPRWGPEGVAAAVSLSAAVSLLVLVLVVLRGTTVQPEPDGAEGTTIQVEAPLAAADAGRIP
jgi:O-antigen/teichoic acid export membrane protein